LGTSCPVGHTCQPHAGFDNLLRGLGINPDTVDLNRLGPPKCPRRLMCATEADRQAAIPIDLAQRVGTHHGPCATCGLPVVTWKGGSQRTHVVPVDPPETRGQRFLAAQQHRPQPRRIA
jgi:hypothetical protein